MPETTEEKQRGINMVDLMMWLVIAALLLATAIQSIGYYQQASLTYQAKSDLSGAHSWAAARTALDSKAPTSAEMSTALTIGDLKLTNNGGVYNIGVIATTGDKYCLGVKAPGVKGNNVFYSTSDSPNNVMSDVALPAFCGTATEVTTTGVSTVETPSTATASPSATVTPTTPVPTMLASWGYNSGQFLGGTSATYSVTPLGGTFSGPLAGKIVSSIDVGDSHACGISEGQAYCWGSNNAGQLGNGNNGYQAAPVAVKAVAGILANKTVTSISAGNKYSCAVADNKAYCWGSNVSGKLGNNSTTDTNVPVAVGGVLATKNVTSINADISHTCAIAEGAAYCWGDNTSGKLGDGTVQSRLLPVSVKTDAGVLAGKTVTALTAGNDSTCAIADLRAYCWGFNGNFGKLGNNSSLASNVPVPVGGAVATQDVTSISAGLTHTCAIAGGVPYCWGNNSYGQLGSGNKTASMLPVLVDTSGAISGNTVTSISAENNVSCAIASGSAYCWGAYSMGQLGNGGSVDVSSPVAVKADAAPLLGRTIVSIEVESNYVSALYK